MLMCRDLARSASDYVEGQLGRADTVAIKMHLLMCRHCRRFVSNLRASIALLRHHSHLSAQGVDPHYLQRLDSAIERELQAREDP
ncbi:zf-HC2 domain-containing protein [Marinobacter sp. X15-166B]|uniref:anti-sigma factor family protein n=1 Tax=Marinobacter sp. X15-166B TaxID=1897620 RepID=UPI00085C0AAE|nr:zf-HC2 domain-containing protein [Marinobacter sp. X15-166B]OEY66202.1 hypothetical protein BG841_06850 [Marinobacter sp. X15-166B]